LEARPASGTGAGRASHPKDQACSGMHATGSREYLNNLSPMGEMSDIADT